jgi:hypothetical protein
VDVETPNLDVIEVAIGEAHSAAIAALLELDGVLRISLPRGQVLVYQGHIPPGVFVVTKGRIACDSSLGTNELLDSKRGPFCVPSVGRVNEPAPSNYRIDQAAELLYIPRSLFLGDSAAAKLLREHGLGDTFQN